MIRYCILLLLLSANMSTRAQKMPDDYELEGRQEMFRKDDAAALRDFNFLITHYPKSVYCSSAHSYMGSIYEGRKEYQKAIQHYKATVFDRHPPMLSEGIISAYDDRVRATYKLSELYEQTGRYDSALYFMYLYDTGFYKMYGCGYETAGLGERNALRYAALNIKANRINDAEQALLSHIVFTWQKRDSMPVYMKLKELLVKYEEPTTLKAQLNEAVEHYYIDTVRKQYGDRQYTTVFCCINFMGVKVRYNFNNADQWLGDAPTIINMQQDNPPNRDKVIAYFRKSELYYLVMGL